VRLCECTVVEWRQPVPEGEGENVDKNAKEGGQQLSRDYVEQRFTCRSVARYSHIHTYLRTLYAQ